MIERLTIIIGALRGVPVRRHPQQIRPQYSVHDRILAGYGPIRAIVDTTKNPERVCA